MRLLFLPTLVYKETIKVKKVSIFLAYIKKKLYLCSRFGKKHESRPEMPYYQDCRRTILSSGNSLCFYR